VILGRALTGHRDRALIVTKGGMIWDEKSFVLGQDSSRSYLMEGLDASLRRLGTDYVDLFLLHWPDAVTPMDEIAANLEALVATGKARAVGVCNLRAEQLREVAAAATSHAIVTSQVGFSLFDRRWADETFAICRELGIGVMAYGPLAHGILTDTFVRQTDFDASDWRASGVIFGQPLLTLENRPANIAVVDALQAVSRELGCSLAQLAIAWTLTHDPVTVSLVGARTADEIRDSAAAADVVLSEDVLNTIESIMSGAAGMTTELPAGGTSKATQQRGA
jgi:aryl-alcohol dehydrogenase-like predicted oxidoreductase